MIIILPPVPCFTICWAPNWHVWYINSFQIMYLCMYMRVYECACVGVRVDKGNYTNTHTSRIHSKLCDFYCLECIFPLCRHHRRTSALTRVGNNDVYGYERAYGLCVRVGELFTWGYVCFDVLWRVRQMHICVRMHCSYTHLHTHTHMHTHTHTHRINTSYILILFFLMKRFHRLPYVPHLARILHTYKNIHVIHT